MNDSSNSIPRFDAHRTDRFTSKFWITPDNVFVPLATWHFQYFANPTISARWAVPFGPEDPTRLAALGVGFLRVNYELRGGKLALETIRWDKELQKLTTELVLANADAIDVVHLHRLESTGQAVELASLSLQTRRRYHLPINRRAISGWNRLKEAPIR